MKNRVVISVIILFCVAIIITSGSAEEFVPYAIKDTDVIISVPDDWYLVDRGLKADDPACEFLSLRGKEYVDTYLTENRFFLAFDKEYNYILDFRFGINESRMDYRNATDNEIIEMCKNDMAHLKDEYNIFLSQVIRYDVPFFLQILEAKNGEDAFIYCDTIIDGKYYDLYLRDYSGYRYEDRILMENILQRIAIDSVSHSQSIDDLKVNDEWKHCYLPQRKISIGIPENYEIIMQDTQESKLFTQSRLNSLKNTMIQSGDYLTAIVPDLSRTIIVNVKDNLIEELAALTDDEINTVFSLIEKSYVNVSVLKKEVVREENDICLKFWVNHDTYKSLEYGTIIDNQGIWIKLMIDDGNITEDDELLIEQIWKQSNLKKHDE